MEAACLQIAREHMEQAAKRAAQKWVKKVLTLMCVRMLNSLSFDLHATGFVSAEISALGLGVKLSLNVSDHAEGEVSWLWHSGGQRSGSIDLSPWMVVPASQEFQAHCMDADVVHPDDFAFECEE
eukprot:3549095-Amphidinium_carterae.1